MRTHASSSRLAQRSGTSKHDAVLRAIDEGIQPHDHRQRHRRTQQTVERWGDALERLGVTPCRASLLSLEDLLDIVSALKIGPVRSRTLNAALR